MSKVRQLDGVIDIFDTYEFAAFDETAKDSNVSQEVTQVLIDVVKVDKDIVVHSMVAQEKVSTPNATGLAMDRDRSGVMQVSWNR